MLLKMYAVLLGLLFTPQTQVLSLKQSIAVLDTSVLMRIKVYRTDPETGKIQYGMGGCSGTYIGPNHILTAAHCFGHPYVGLWVRGTDHMSIPATLIKVDPERDLALLAVPGESRHHYAKLASSAGVGEQVINVGSPFQLEFLVSEGIIACLSWKFKEFKAHYMITTAMINPGSSGGGAFNDKGELLGVNTMTIGGPFGWNGITLAVDTQTIKEFLK